MRSIGGTLPDPTDPPPGCRFAARCPHAVDACTDGEQPPQYAVSTGDEHAVAHEVSCVHFGPGGDPSVVLGERAETAGSDGPATGTGGDD
jgi:peptide/nickel transport system ATP-binding protein